jgi:hypothetical protein
MLARPDHVKLGTALRGTGGRSEGHGGQPHGIAITEPMMDRAAAQAWYRPMAKRCKQLLCRATL